MNTSTYNAGNNYEVEIGEEALVSAGKFISEKGYGSLFILVDSNTSKFCLPVLLDSHKIFKSAFVIEVLSGENKKNLNTCEIIFSSLVEKNADRKSLLINLGGGVVCDLGGFAASVYKRGIDFMNIPTTLLSMVDASVGGKTGVNFMDGKNMIGTFNNPCGIFVFPEFNKTLSVPDFRSGFAEIMKHILLSDVDRWGELKNTKDYFNLDNLIPLIKHSVQFKTEVANDDFKENGRRKILNFGHTIGHALESCMINSSNPLRHGEAVALGIVAETWMSVAINSFPESELRDLIRIVKKMFPELSVNIQSEDLFRFLNNDKKNEGDKIAFSLLRAPGVPAGISFPLREEIIGGINFMNEYFSKAIVHDKN